MSGNITNLIGKSAEFWIKQEMHQAIVTIAHSVEPSIITVIAMMVTDKIYFDLEMELFARRYEDWK